MIDLYKEAEEWCHNNDIGYGGIVSEAFEAGVNSKHVRQQIIEAQLDLLKSFYYGEDLKVELILDFYKSLYNDIKTDLEEELKQLQNGR